MIFSKKLRFISAGKECLFKTISENDVTYSYVNGLKRQNKYLLNTHNTITIEWQKKYVNELLVSEVKTICGLFVDGKLIGTATVKKIKKSKTITIGIIGIFIFDISSRGKGFGKLLVWCSCYLAHHSTALNIFGAGMEKNNIASLHSFLACDFIIIDENDKYYNVEVNIDKLLKPKKINNIEVF